eukprot:g43315.t1
MAHRATVSNTVHDLIASGDLPSSFIVSQPHTARFYLLPKIHKPNYPGRPIVSPCSCTTELISSYFNSILPASVQALPTYIRDTNHTLHLFGVCHGHSQGPQLCLPVCQLSNSPSLVCTLTPPHPTAFRKDHSLRYFIVRATLPTNHSKPPGTSP